MVLTDFLGPVVRLKAPERRDLYVFEQAYPFGAGFYFFILFDAPTRNATRQPPSICAKWMEGEWGSPLEKPIVAFRDLDGDGAPELVVQERVHNGTMYNAVMYHYFRVGADLSLSHVLAIETRLFDLYTGGVIERSIQTVSPLEIKLTARLRHPGTDAPPETLGLAVLKRGEHDAAFRVAERYVLDEKDRELLVTAFGIDEDDAILAEGYREYY